MNKRILIAFLFCVIGSCLYATNKPSSMALSSISGEPGQQVQLPLIFRSGSPQIDSLSFDIVVPTEMAFVQGSLSHEAQDKYKQISIQPNKNGAHIEIKSWSSHPYYKGALFIDGEIARFIISIPRDGGMSGYTFVEGPRDVKLENVKASNSDKISIEFISSPGVITVLQNKN